MGMNINGIAGVQLLSDGQSPAAQRIDKQGGMMVSELHGKYYELNYRGNVFTGGIVALTSISNATYAIGTTGATATPVVGLYNPASNNVNLEVLEANLQITLTALQATGAGGFMWMYSLGNNAITTGSTPINCKTLTASGSNAKVFGAAALTGMTGTLAVLRASSLNGGANYNASLLGTAVGFMPGPTPCVENVDGKLIVPPGGVLALMAMGTPVALSAISGITWAESPV